MNVCILNMKGNFDKTLGLGTQRTSYELWKNIKPLAEKEGINVDRVELGFGSSPTARKISFTLMLYLRDFSKYDIVHLLIVVPRTPRAGRNTKILTTVNEFMLLDKNTVAYRILSGTDPKRRVTIRERVSSSLSHLVGTGMSRQIFSSDYISVNSTQTRHEAIKLGYPKDRIFIVPHGVDERFLSKVKGKDHKGLRVGYIGALNKRKNIQFAIDAFKRLKQKDAEFEIWGRPVLGYRDLVELADGDKRIKFMGFAPEDRLVQIYDRFDAFVFPSLYEGFGLPIIEAQARGLPVIIYKEGMIPEEVRRHCLVARDELHMAQMLGSLSKNGYDKGLQKKATEYARSFTRRKEAQDTLEVYRKICERDSAGRRSAPR
ncbi:MAG: glycosyltransferase [Candidatus Marsarchaeota archaeon]|nr:glycosyltransferase [Candidatus Marsarchaeota archaeon]MCL5413345.1 glycosyltransferase [Candidatus Marsarchaeota archaeon]